MNMKVSLGRSIILPEAQDMHEEILVWQANHESAKNLIVVVELV